MTKQTEITVEEMKAGRDNRANQLNPNHKEYKNPVVFLRKSKAGDHLFVFDSREDLVAGGTLIVNVSDVERLIGGGTDWIKVSVLPPESAADRVEREE
jgi:hypothetical protein